MLAQNAGSGSYRAHNKRMLMKTHGHTHAHTYTYTNARTHAHTRAKRKIDEGPSLIPTYRRGPMEANDGQRDHVTDFYLRFQKYRPRRRSSAGSQSSAPSPSTSPVFPTSPTYGSASPRSPVSDGGASPSSSPSSTSSSAHLVNWDDPYEFERHVNNHLRFNDAGCTSCAICRHKTNNLVQHVKDKHVKLLGLCCHSECRESIFDSLEEAAKHYVERHGRGASATTSASAYSSVSTTAPTSGNVGNCGSSGGTEAVFTSPSGMMSLQNTGISPMKLLLLLLLLLFWLLLLLLFVLKGTL